MKFFVAVALATVASVQAGCFPEGTRPPKLSYEEKLALAHNHQPVDAENHHHGGHHHLPREFDWEDVEGVNYLAPSWNQHIPVYCGSCWLHATLSSVQDRIKIKKRARGVDTMLARQVLLQCGPLANMSNGCHGGEPRNVFDYMRDYGLPDETCMLYKADDQQFMHLKKEGKQCPAEARCWNCMHGHKPECFAIENPLVYKVESYGPVEPNEESIMREVYHRGPVVCSMATTDDFDYGYHGGVWVPPKKSDDVNHDVEVVGWGVDEDGTKYWRVRNSWGTYWGEKGFFKIRRGENDYEIEKDCWYAIPTWEMEHELDEGKLVGDMIKGLIKNPKWEEMEKKIKEYEEKEKAEEEKIREEIKKRMEEREKELEEMREEMEKMREEQAEAYRERMRERIQRLREEAERRRHRYEEVFGEGEAEEEEVAERLHEVEHAVAGGDVPNVRLSAIN